MIPHGNLQGIVAFVESVESGSFTRAARRMSLSKSAVAKSVARLESQLTVRLIDRTTRRFQLTAEGESFLESCRKALGELDAARDLIAARRHPPSGRLRIDLPLVFGRRVVAPILFELAERYPSLSFEIGFSDRHVDLIEEAVDLAIRMGEIGDTGGLVARRLCRLRSAIFAAARYLAKHGRPSTIEDLTGHLCIRLGSEGRIAPWRLALPAGGTRTVSPPGRLLLGNPEAVLDAALAGQGLAYLPSWLADEHVRRGELEMVLPESAVDDVAVHVLWAITRHPAPKARVVIDELVRRFTSSPLRGAPSGAAPANKRAES
jgi:DNA-binding transcriptional LysR family regulator